MMFQKDGEEVFCHNKKAGIKLTGTLTLPDAEGQFPVALLISGSSATDRDGTWDDHKPIRELAGYLKGCGIAVLRVDDRGVNKSDGEPESFYKCTGKDCIEDVFACIERLKSHNNINSKQIGLIGHSQGGLVASMVAAKWPEDIAFIVLMATPGLTGEQNCYLQGLLILEKKGASLETIARHYDMQRSAFKVLKDLDKGLISAVAAKKTIGNIMDSFLENYVTSKNGKWISRKAIVISNFGK